MDKENGLTRPNSSELNNLIGREFKVLDDGFVRVVDYMGTDDSIVQAARVSYGKGTKRVSEDRGLIRYLMRHKHTTPFEMCEIKLHVRVPMDCWRQWIRHRTANVNEYSTRYSEAINACQKTKADQWRQQATLNRQGSGQLLDSEVGDHLSLAESNLLEISRQVYEERLSSGVAREQARKDLPLSTYTEAYWKCDLHNLFHFLSLRMDSHAQKEIREYAEVIGNQIVSIWCPIAWEAFVDYRLNTTYFSKQEITIVRAVVSGDTDLVYSTALELGFIVERSGKRALSREGREFQHKLTELGFGHGLIVDVDG